MRTNFTPTFDVYTVRTSGPGIAGTSRRAGGVAWVAVERGPLDPRVEPEHVIKYHGVEIARGKREAIVQAQQARKAAKKRKRGAYR